MKIVAKEQPIRYRVFDRYKFTESEKNSILRSIPRKEVVYYRVFTHKYNNKNIHNYVIVMSEEELEEVIEFMNQSIRNRPSLWVARYAVAKLSEILSQIKEGKIKPVESEEMKVRHV